MKDVSTVNWMGVEGGGGGGEECGSVVLCVIDWGWDSRVKRWFGREEIEAER